MSKQFQSDHINILNVLNNQRPNYLTLYKDHIDAPFISKVLGEKVSPEGLNSSELEDYYRKVIGFWKNMTYDVFVLKLPFAIFYAHGAIMGGMVGDAAKTIRINEI